ncbi:MAG: hypothetical protein RIS70_4207 [Planctomycetota bacterium]
MVKKMMVAALVVVGLLTVGTGAFRARAEVAREKLTSKIDSVLGDMDVKRKEIELGVSGFRDGLTKLRKAKVKAEVQREQLARRIEPVKDKIDNIDSALKKVRDQLASGSVAEIAGVKYEPHQLQRLAKQMLQDRQRNAAELDGYHKSQDQLTAIATTLGQKQSEYEQRLSGVECQIALIESRKTALTAMREAAAAMDGNEESFAVNVAELEHKVSDLYAGIEAELAGENARWSKDGLVASDQLDAIIASSEGSDELIARIDRTVAPGTQAVTAK